METLQVLLHHPARFQVRTGDQIVSTFEFDGISASRFPKLVLHQHFARKIDRLQCNAGKLVPVLPSEMGFRAL